MTPKENNNEGSKMPVLFIGHGSPMNVISDNNFTQNLKKLGNDLPKPKAILVISAHWLTSGTRVLCSKQPSLIYDFYGFPEELYQIEYPCFGLPELATSIGKKLEYYKVICDYEWGYDHASWAILKHIYPNADIPVLELSLDYGFSKWSVKPMEYHYKLAKNLRFLREQGVLIIGSGNIVHNLRIIDYNVNAPIMNWAKQLDEAVKKNLLKYNHQKLINFKEMGNVANMGIPTWDHYLPLIYTIALQEKDEPIKFIHEGFQHGSVSMRCIQFGKI
ncbi:MAG: 4,5-DOPA dioxygenase extradiol [Promethearchaeota archaeon]